MLVGRGQTENQTQPSELFMQLFLSHWKDILMKKTLGEINK